MMLKIFKNKKGITENEILLIGELLIAIIAFFGFVHAAQLQVSGEILEMDREAKAIGLYANAVIASPYPVIVKLGVSPDKVYTLGQNNIVVEDSRQIESREFYFINTKEIEEETKRDIENLYIKKDTFGVIIDENSDYAGQSYLSIDTEANTKEKELLIDISERLPKIKVFLLAQKFNLEKGSLYGQCLLTRTSSYYGIDKRREFVEQTGGDLLIGLKNLEDTTKKDEIIIYYKNNLESKKLSELNQKNFQELNLNKNVELKNHGLSDLDALSPYINVAIYIEFSYYNKSEDAEIINSMHKSVGEFYE